MGSRAYYEANRDKVREAQRVFRAANREKTAARRRAYSEANAERIRARDRERYRANRDAHLARMADYHATNPERVAEHKRRYYNANVADHRERQRAYDAANPDKRRDRMARYRARKAAAPLVEVIDRGAIIARDKSTCHLCGKRVPRSRIHLDHIVPLARGGEHTAANLAVSHGLCNQRKGDRADIQS